MHTEKLLEAARHGHLDNMRGVSANVMTGQFGYFGTGAFNVMLDLQEMEALNENPERVAFTNYREKTEQALQQAHETTKNMACDMDTIKIDNHLMSIEAKETICHQDDYDMGF